MKNKMRLFLSTICTLLLMSCVNLVGDDNSGVDSSGGKCTITGTITLSGASRTAVPDLKIADYFYEVKATNDAVPPEEVDGIVDAVHHTFSITLADGNWDITVNGYQSQVGDVFSNKLLTTTNSIVVANNGVSAGSLTFKLKMIQTPANPASSTVELPIKVDSSITDVEAIWQESGVEKIQTIITNGAQTTANFTMKADGASSNTATSGNYPVVFKFYSTVNGVKVLCYSLVETVALYDYLPTNSWLNNTNAPYITLGIMDITANIIRNFDYKEFYVSSTGNNKNSGGFFDPFASVQAAVAIIQAIANPEVEQYTIYLKDNITLASDYTDWPMQSDGVTPEDSYVTINPSSSLKIKITSYGEPATPYKIDANRSAANPGRVMYVGEKAEVTLENITITGGCSNINGAGVFINSGKLTLNKNASINMNNFAIDGKSGAGIYCDYGTITMNDGSEISSNGNVTHLANGGGIYLKGSESDLTKKAVLKMEPGSKVHHNVGYSGAGIKILYGSDSYIHGAEITDNKAVYTTNDNGGGVWAAMLSGNVLEIKDTSLINNTVNCGTTGGGGALYVHLGTVLLNGTTLFENNSGVTGNAIRMLNTKDQNVVLADSVKFDNSTIKQTIAYDYSSATGTPYIKLGKLTGTVADQTVYLTISPLTEGNPVLVPNSAAVNIADYADRFIVLNSDLTPSNYEIDDEGKLKSNIVIGPNGGFASSAYEVVSTIEACGGTLPSAGVYSLSTEAELEQLATWSQTNTLSGFTFVLYDNIILPDSDFTPIASGSSKFKGIFDGNGNSVSNMHINRNASYAGFICNTDYNAVIKNLSVEGEITNSSGGYTGGICGRLYGTSVIDNCVSNVRINYTGATGTSIGGIAGAIGSGATIKNCINIGSVTSSSTSVGGITGNIENNCKILNCANFGVVNASYLYGGIGGNVTGGEISNSYNAGKIIPIGGGNTGGTIDGSSGSSATYKNVYWITGTIADGPTIPGVSECTLADVSSLKTILNAGITDASVLNSSAATYNEWNSVYTVNSIDYPVCTTFVLPETLPPLASMSTPPTDLGVIYPVSSASDIYKLEEWVAGGNQLDGLKFELSEDITLQTGDPTWVPIGTEATPFKGSFDGQGKTVNFNYSTGSGNVGLFGVIDGAIIKNVKVKGAVNSTGDNVGGIVGKATGGFIIENCEVECTFTVSSCNNVGGIVGYIESGNGFIRNCYNKNEISATDSCGGIVGNCDTTVSLLSITNCGNQGRITATTCSGGIIGNVKTSGLYLQNCFNQDTQSKMSSSDYCGLLIGNIVGQSLGDSNIKNNYYNTNAVADPIVIGNTAFTDYDSTSVIGFTPSSKDIGGVQTIICVLDSSPTTDLVADKLNPWCESNSLGIFNYAKWKYDNSGIILFDN